MSIESPTLKIRVKLADDTTFLGRDCHEVARELISSPDVTVLDSNWGREPTAWQVSGGWGRPKLTAHQRGFVEAVEMGAREGSMQQALVAIIRELTR